MPCPPCVCFITLKAKLNIKTSPAAPATLRVFKMNWRSVPLPPTSTSRLLRHPPTANDGGSAARKRFLQVHSTIIARRNAAIFDYNAWPKMGGEMPRAPRVQYE